MFFPSFFNRIISFSNINFFIYIICYLLFYRCMPKLIDSFLSGVRRDLNPHKSEPQSDALPICHAHSSGYGSRTHYLTGYEPGMIFRFTHPQVGVQRFELWTSRTQTERSTKLSHTPKKTRQNLLY